LGRLGYAVSGSGRPAIVLLNGAGVSLEGWQELYPALERLGTVFAYNRFGVKGSDPPQQPQTGAMVIAALRELLAYAGVESPWVLVGHSMGCLFAELFARLHPLEVAALLLVEPVQADDPRSLRSHEDEFAHATSRVLGLPQPMLEANLHGELACLEETLRQLEAAPALPDIPRRVLHTNGHFPQLSQPQSVLDALQDVIAGLRSTRR
jgi:pimeloyl-ACP methyl ester carboxylesterase